MSKNMMIVVSIVIVVLVGYKIYTLEFKETEVFIPEVKQEEQQNTNLNQEETSVVKEESTDVSVATKLNGDTSTNTLATEPILQPQKLGSYEAYDSSKLAYANDGHVILFFNASWCPTCRALDKDIKQNISNIPSGVTILNVNYDNSTDLKKKYGVTYQHTLVEVDSQGNMIKKWQGSRSLNSLIIEIS